MTYMEYLTISNVLHFEIRKVQIKITFVKDKASGAINTTVEDNYCIADNIEFSITKVE